MEIESLTQLLGQLGVDRGLFVWILILAGREIRRLYQARLEEKDNLCKEKEQRMQLLQRELEHSQRKLRDLFHKTVVK
jgi:hypothetical protein